MLGESEEYCCCIVLPCYHSVAWSPGGQTRRCNDRSSAPYSGFSSTGKGRAVGNPLVTDGVRHAGPGALGLGEFSVGNENAGRGNAVSWTDSFFLFFFFGLLQWRLS
jgi:hypothetical protein